MNKQELHTELSRAWTEFHTVYHEQGFALDSYPVMRILDRIAVLAQLFGAESQNELTA